MSQTLLIFGATGDLAGRLLLPGVAALQARHDERSVQVRVVGSGPQNWTDHEFAAHVNRRLAEHAADLPAGARDEVVAGLRYRPADIGEPTEVAAAVREARRVSNGNPVVVYLALPTRFMLAAVRALTACGLPPGSRIAVEKPFGDDADGAAALTAALAGHSTYRVDHALALTTVQHLAEARDPVTGEALVWSGRQVERVELLWEETLALEGRASFYDRAGALRDVVQNHLLQLLCAVAREPGDDAAGRRADVLRAVHPLTATDVRSRTRRARYAAGRLADGSDRQVPDYAAEDGVDPARATETFAEMTVRVDTPRWEGTTFVLRAGKALAARRRGALVHLRSRAEPIWLDVDDPATLRPAQPAAGDGPGGAETAAYRRIVGDLLTGGTAYAVSADETELAWRVVTPVLRAWAADAVALDTYTAGSAGPG